ncbi:MAG: hypothetical protein RMJ59_04950 [Candidatus Nitrosocaldus sp.]|nr:hypothetical protein [Candidatus Nitrosocaldus sp.]MDW8275712.1 hypothetical protein [Candidatus Nitrosocaldus sp.]
MRIAEITKVKGATLPDVSICNNGRPIFRDPRDRLRVMDDGSVKRFVINSRDVSISIYIVARWKPEFAGIELTGNCRVVCYADDESAVCPVCDTQLIHEGGHVFCPVCGYVKGRFFRRSSPVRDYDDGEDEG